jgi:magnesium chelatase subunit H
MVDGRTGCARGCTFDEARGVRQMESCSERAEALAARVVKLIALRRAEAACIHVGAVA